VHRLRVLLLLLPLAAYASDGALLGSAASLVERAQAAVRVEPEKSREYAEQALVMLARQPDPELQARAHLLLCDYHTERDRAKAEHHIERGRELLPHIRRKGLAAGLLSCEGELREGAGDSAGAMALYEQAVTIGEQAQDGEMAADAMFRRGYLRGVRGEFAAGLGDLKRAFASYQQLQLPNHALTAQNAIAILYNRLGDTEQAVHYFEAALKAQTAVGLLRERAVTQHNMGRALENLQRWDDAQQAFQSVLGLSRELGFVRGEAYALRGLASVHNARGAPAEALSLLAQAERLQRRVPDVRLRGQIALQQGIALRQLQRPGESLAALKEAVAVFRDFEALSERASAHDELATTLANLGDWAGAYEQQAQAKAAAVQLLKRQLDERFATLKIEYDIAAKDQEMRLLERERAATQRSLEQEQLAGRFRTAAIVLAGLLLAFVGNVAWRHRRASHAMHKLAMTDELTGLPNRRDVLTRLDRLLQRPQDGCALLIVDLDHFKPINDTHGHLVGDHILRAVADVLRDTGRDPVALGRLGGEEFVVLLPGAGAEAACAVAERLRGQVASLDVSRWLPDRGVTISIGVTVANLGDSASSMLRRADEALYAAKDGGRNCVKVQLAAPADGSTP
jgi:diguanylate cyclase (GGDEF)-like protein